MTCSSLGTRAEGPWSVWRPPGFRGAPALRAASCDAFEAAEQLNVLEGKASSVPTEEMTTPLFSHRLAALSS